MRRRTALLLLAAAVAALTAPAVVQCQGLTSSTGDLQRFGDVPTWDPSLQRGPPHPPPGWDRRRAAPVLVNDDSNNEGGDDDSTSSAPPQLPTKPAPPPALVTAKPAAAPVAVLPKPAAAPATAAAAAAAAAAAGRGGATALPSSASGKAPDAAAQTPAVVSASIELRGPDVSPWTTKAETALINGAASMLAVPVDAVTVADVKELPPGPPAPTGRRALRQDAGAQQYPGTSLTLAVTTPLSNAGTVTEHLLASTAGTGELATALGVRGVQPKSAAVLRADTMVLPPPGAGADDGSPPRKPSERVSTRTAVTAAVCVLAVSAVGVGVFMSLKRCLGGRDGGAASAADAAKAVDAEKEGAKEVEEGVPPPRTASGAAAFFLNLASPRGGARTVPAGDA